LGTSLSETHGNRLGRTSGSHVFSPTCSATATLHFYRV